MPKIFPEKLNYPSSHAIAAHLNRLLRVSAVSDSARNGLQMESRRPVRIVAAAVDASLATFEAAAQAGADLLLVHHGLFWGEEQQFTPALIRRVRALVDFGLSLYASHLPLDRHPQFGNNACLARALGLTEVKPFGLYHGQRIGYGGRAPQPVTLKQLQRRLQALLGARVRVFPFGPERIRRVAVVSGGAGDLAAEAAEGGYEAFVTGEVGHSAYHICKESGINVVAGGHYATETFGVKALAEYVAKTYKVARVFIDIPTGM